MTGEADLGCAAGDAGAGRSGPAAAGMCQGRRGSRDRALPPPRRGPGGRGRSAPGRLPGRAGRRALRRREMDVDPAGVLLGSGRFGPGCADPDQDQAVPAAETGQCGVGASCGQHGGVSGQDRVQPDRRSVADGHQRVGDQAAEPQRGGDAGREEAPRGVAAGRRPSAAGWPWSPWPGRCGRCGPRRPGRSGGRRRRGPGRRSSPSRPGRPFSPGPWRAGGVRCRRCRAGLPRPGR